MSSLRATPARPAPSPCHMHVTCQLHQHVPPRLARVRRVSLPALRPIGVQRRRRKGRLRPGPRRPETGQAAPTSVSVVQSTTSFPLARSRGCGRAMSSVPAPSSCVQPRETHASVAGTMSGVGTSCGRARGCGGPGLREGALDLPPMLRKDGTRTRPPKLRPAPAAGSCMPGQA